MANALGKLFADIADAIRSKTGETGKMKPMEFPAEILSIAGGSSNVRVDMGMVTFTSSDIVNGVATFEHNLGVMPDYILFFALDSPRVTSSDPYYMMGYAATSKALAEKAVEKNPNISTTGFILGKSYSQGDPNDGYNYIASMNTDYYYEQWIASKGNIFPGYLGAIYDVTINDISFGAPNSPMKPGREFFYALIGNLF